MIWIGFDDKILSKVPRCRLKVNKFELQNYFLPMLLMDENVVQFQVLTKLSSIKAGLRGIFNLVFARGCSGTRISRPIGLERLERSSLSIDYFSIQLQSTNRY